MVDNLSIPSLGRRIQLGVWLCPRIENIQHWIESQSYIGTQYWYNGQLTNSSHHASSHTCSPFAIMLLADNGGVRAWGAWSFLTVAAYCCIWAAMPLSWRKSTLNLYTSISMPHIILLWAPYPKGWVAIVHVTWLSTQASQDRMDVILQTFCWFWHWSQVNGR